MKKPTLAELLRRILSRPPQKPDDPWDDDRSAFEQALCAAARPDQMPGVERRIDELRAAGFDLETISEPGNDHWREWQVRLDDTRYVATVTALVHPDVQSAHLVYKDKPPKVRRTRAHRLQDAFYARYNGLWDQLRADSALWDRYSADRATAFGADDRRLLLVGDFEGDVNNGGFSQYLSNKGLPEARLALAAMQAIGARRTAHMLEEALEHPDDESVLERLTNAFYERAEDLAALAAQHARLSPARKTRSGESE
jgi:hypothetical protein